MKVELDLDEHTFPVICTPEELLDDSAPSIPGF